MVGILFFGLIILFSTSSYPAHKSFGDAHYYIKKQIIFIALGLPLLMIVSGIPHRIWQTLAWPLYTVSIVLLVMVFLPVIGKAAGGAHRWINIGGIFYQPSDLARFATVLLIARIFSKEERIGSEGKVQAIRVFLSLIVIALPVALISWEPDFGTAFHLILVVVFLLFLTNFPFVILLTIGISVTPIIYYNVIQVPWRLKRMIAFLNPWEYRYEEGYQLVAAFKSFLEGGFWGKGLGEGVVRHKLQARHTDFIFSVIAEEMGLLGISILLLVFLFIAVYGMLLLKKVAEPFAKLLGSGILLIFILQVIIHINVNMGLLPTTGISLPLISYGGTSIITYLFMFGILLNILKTRERV